MQSKIHRSFECNLILATSYRSDKRVHFSNNQFMNGILTWFDCNSSFRNLRIILSDLRFHNTFQFVKYGASALFFFTAFGIKRSQRALTSKFFIICSCSIKVWQLQLAVFHHKRKTFKIFFRKRQLNVLKNFLFPTTDFERDIIPAKI